MKRISVPVLFVGLLFVAMAVFAQAIGLDRNAGSWGRARTLMLILGIVIISAALLHFRFKSRVDQVLMAFSSFTQNHAFISWIWRNEGLLYAGRLLRNYSNTFPILVTVLIFYVWLVSSGTWTEWVSPTRFYASLAKGFEFGMLSTMMEPDPKLLEIENPYDPVNWRGIVEVPMDITYYQGRFYLYWGPTPAFLLYLLHPFIWGRIGDLYLAFAFICGIFLSQFILLIAIWDRFFLHLPRWTLYIPLVLSGLACPLTFMLGAFKGARIYEAAISSGQFFLLTGFLVILTALNKRGFSSNWRLLLAGTLWALAFGSRMPLLFAVGFLVVMVAYWFYRARISSLVIAQRIFLLCLPVAAGLVAIGWYNWARFGSVTESGLYYQMTSGLYLQKYNKEMADPIYILQNIYNYVFYPFDVSSQFPFFSPRYTYQTAIFSFYPLPELYAGQWITGMLWTVPFVIFAVLPLFRITLGFFNRRPKADFLTDEVAKLNWLILTLIGTFLAAFVFLLVFFWAAMRYLADFMPFLLVLSIIGFWQGYQMLSEKPRQRRLYTGFAVLLAGVSMVNSTLLAISVNDAKFVLVRLFPFLG